jgi:hypothetical protein
MELLKVPCPTKIGCDRPESAGRVG